jgi:Family of unknown function (DUF5675)
MKSTIQFLLLIFLAIYSTKGFAQSAAGSTNAVTTLYLNRTSEFVSSTNKAGKVSQARRGVMQAGNLTFPTIERKGVMSLRKGTYECVMEEQRKEDGSLKRRVFRIKAEGAMGHHLKNASGAPAPILIHPSNYAYQLEGCIAPGRKTSEEGVDDSVAALSDIFRACGGFVEGKKVLLVVRN